MSKELKIGLFGIATILIFVLGFNYLKGTSLFNRQNEYHVYYDDVFGITEGTQVKLNGISVGLVKNLAFKSDNPNLVDVTYAIHKDVKLPEDSKALIASDGVLGNKIVKLILGTKKTYVQDNGTFLGEQELGIMESAMEQINPIKTKVESTLTSLDSILIAVKKVFSDGNIQNLNSSFANIPPTIDNLKETSKDVNVMVKTQSERLDHILLTVDNITTNLKTNNEKINNILSNAETTTENLKKLELQKTLDQVDKTLADLQITIGKINNGTGTVSLLLNDDKLYNNLDKSAADLDKLMIDLKANPKKYVHFSIFGRKDKDGKVPLPETTNGN